MKFVLSRRGGLGAEPELLNKPEGYWADESWYTPAAPPTSPTSSDSSFFGSLFSSLTSPAAVTATLNKYVFGSTSPIPTQTNYVPKLPGQSLIAGIPDTYLMIGGALALFAVMSKKRR